MLFNLSYMQIRSIYLRVYFTAHCPTVCTNTPRSLHPCRVVSLLMETKEQLSILQNCTGKFVFATNAIQNEVEEGCF